MANASKAASGKSPGEQPLATQGGAPARFRLRGSEDSMMARAASRNRGGDFHCADPAMSL